jgi:transposase
LTGTEPATSRTFHLVGLDKRGAIAMRIKLSRDQLVRRLVNLPPCLIGLEAGSGSHHIARQIQSLGHDVRLIPAQYVKPFLKGHKNDYRDAEAIAEAVQRPTVNFVAIKTPEQSDLLSLHRVRSRLVRQRTAIINQIRGFLIERGITVRQGPRPLRKVLPDVLSSPPEALSPRLLRLIDGCHHGAGDDRADAGYAHQALAGRIILGEARDLGR